MGTGFNDRISNYIKDIAIFYIYIKLNPTKEEHAGRMKYNLSYKSIHWNDIPYKIHRLPDKSLT